MNTTLISLQMSGIFVVHIDSLNISVRIVIAELGKCCSATGGSSSGPAALYDPNYFMAVRTCCSVIFISVLHVFGNTVVSLDSVLSDSVMQSGKCVPSSKLADASGSCLSPSRPILFIGVFRNIFARRLSC